jgi:hypothetical protein
MTGRLQIGIDGRLHRNTQILPGRRKDLKPFGVAGQRLDDADIGSVLEQVSGKGMPQRMDVTRLERLAAGSRGDSLGKASTNATPQENYWNIQGSSMFEGGQQRTFKDKTMFIKILAVSALSIGLATSALAQQSGSNNSGSSSGAGTGSGSSTNSGSGSGNGTSGNSGSSTNTNNGGGNNGGTSGNGASSDGGKASDCNGMSTSKNTTNMKQDQAANPAATSNCP